jgi:hypothetical protein
MPEAAPYHRQLIDQAQALARQEHGRPRQASLRRAVSAAYYALFHWLVDASSTYLVGRGREQLRFRHALARTFSHSEMVQACRSFQAGFGGLPVHLQQLLPGRAVHPGVVDMASAFVDLQEARHGADYDMSKRLSRTDALTLVDLADRSITAWPDGDPSAECLLLTLHSGARMKRT